MAQPNIYPISMMQCDESEIDALMEGIDSELLRCNLSHIHYQLIGIAKNHTLILTENKSDQSKMNHLSIHINNKTIKPFIPKQFLLDEFSTNYEKRYKTKPLIQYRPQSPQIEGMIIVPPHMRQQLSISPQKEGHIKKKHTVTHADIRTPDQEEAIDIPQIEQKEQEDILRRKRDEILRQKDKDAQLKQEEDRTYPQIIHKPAHLNDGLYGQIAPFFREQDSEWFYVLIDGKAFDRETSNEIQGYHAQKCISCNVNKWEINLELNVMQQSDGISRPFKHTDELTGTLVAFGRIKISFYGKDDTYVVYDRKTGYLYTGADHPENEIASGDTVKFNLFSNLVPGTDDSFCYLIDLNDASKYLIAFNVEPAEVIPNAEECDNELIHEHVDIAKEAPPQAYVYKYKFEEEKEDNVQNEEEKDMVETMQLLSLNGSIDATITKNPNCIQVAPISTGNNVQTHAMNDDAYDLHLLVFRRNEKYDYKVFEGQILSKKLKNGYFIGEIKAYPYFDSEPEGCIVHYHSHQFEDATDQVFIGSTVQFIIGSGSSTATHSSYDTLLIAHEIKLTNARRGIPQKPTNLPTSCIGKILVSNSKIIMAKRIYPLCLNKSDKLRMHPKICETKQCVKFPPGSFIRYNEIVLEQNPEPVVICSDYIATTRQDPNRYTFTENAIVPLKADTNKKKAELNGCFKFMLVDIKDQYDILVIAQVAEMYINYFLNSGRGGIIFFGIEPFERQIIGQKGLNYERRQWIEREITRRVCSFEPKVDRNLFHIEEPHQVYDHLGYSKADVFVLKIYTRPHRVNEADPYKTSHGVYYYTDVQCRYFQWQGMMPALDIAKEWHWPTQQ